MEEKRDLTYIEFFDHSAVENICACLAQAPARVILLGDDRVRDGRVGLADGGLVGGAVIDHAGGLA